MFPKWFRPSSDTGLFPSRWRTVSMIIGLALTSIAALAQSTTSIVNGYYGDKPGTTSLSQLISSGATAKLTHLTYSFAQTNTFTDGNSNPCAGLPTAMNLTDIQNLKAQNPNIKIFISLGGQNTDSLFETALANYGSASAFAQACVPALMNAAIPMANGQTSTVPARQYVNGIDIDWEVPGTSKEENDYDQVVEQFRTELNSYASQYSLSRLLLSVAIGPEGSPNPSGYEYIDLPTVKNYVDFVNVEFYNYAYGSPTQSNAPIGEIMQDIFGGSDYGANSGIVRAGIPANQIVLCRSMESNTRVLRMAVL